MNNFTNLEIQKILLDHYKGDLKKVAQVKDAIIVTLRTGSQKRYSQTGIRLLQIFNEKVKKLQNFKIDQTYSCTVSSIDLDGKFLKYNFHIKRNGVPCIYSTFHSVKSMTIEQIKQHITTIFILRRIDGYRDLDPETIN